MAGIIIECFIYNISFGLYHLLTSRIKDSEGINIYRPCKHIKRMNIDLYTVNGQ